MVRSVRFSRLHQPAPRHCTGSTRARVCRTGLPVAAIEAAIEQRAKRKKPKDIATTEIWDKYVSYERKWGDVAAMKRAEARRDAFYAQSSEIVIDIVEKHSYLDQLPCSKEY